MHILKKFLPLIILVIYFGLQLPFLKADPDTVVDINTRGAWTDEGLYASQVKNLVNHGTFDLKENSTFVRGPVFNIIQLPFFLIFGTSLLVARLITIMLTLFVLFLFLKEKKLWNFSVFLLLFVLLEFHIFQFTHYAMVEMMCVDFIMLGLLFFLKTENNFSLRTNLPKIFLASLFMFLCYGAKIQYLYVAAILPITSFFNALVLSVKERKIKWQHYSNFTWFFVFSVGFVLTYYFLWYIPNKEFYDFVMSNESGGRYGATFVSIRRDALFNWIHVFFVSEYKVFIVHFFVILALAIVLFIAKKKKTIHSQIALFSFIWIIIELHKVPMLYLPNRYIISLFFASGVFISSFYSALDIYFKKIKLLIFAIAIAFGIYNLSFYKDAMERKSYQLVAINEYLSNYDLKERPVIGAWASSFCWQNKAVTFPVWNNYFNWKDPVKSFKPSLVISETNEAESDNSYKSQNIDLNKLSDSIRTFDVWRYKINVFWIRN